MVVVFYRIIFHEPIVDRLFPTLFILIAPPAIGFVSYAKLVGQVDGFGKMLYFFALFLTFLLFSQIRYFRKVKFFLSYWAYAFPLAAMSIASAAMYHETNVAVYKGLHVLFLVLVLVLIFNFFCKTIRAAYRRELCVEEEMEGGAAVRRSASSNSGN